MSWEHNRSLEYFETVHIMYSHKSIIITVAYFLLGITFVKQQQLGYFGGKKVWQLNISWLILQDSLPEQQFQISHVGTAKATKLGETLATPPSFPFPCKIFFILSGPSPEVALFSVPFLSPDLHD